MKHEHQFITPVEAIYVYSEIYDAEDESDLLGWEVTKLACGCGKEIARPSPSVSGKDI